jgi:cystathionine beta-lyase/cystathionine gamma-synthase
MADDAVDRQLQPDTIAIRAGRDDNDTALAPILWASTTFATPSVEENFKMATGARATKFYSRYGNPTVKAFEDAVAQLEGAEAALAFGSGMAAVTTTVLALCSSGSHVVAQRQVFSTTSLLCAMVCPRFGIEVTVVDGTDPQAFADAVQPGRTQLLFCETPANPAMALVDLEAVGAIQGPIKVVDSTFATPVVQRPLEHGFDLVLHAATKAMAGHNDALLGVVAGEADLVNWLWGYHIVHGATASPFDAWNGLRGLRTLGVRVRRQSETAQQLAEFLEGHPAVARVLYPGLDSHPQRDLAKRQMALGGGVLSFELRGGLDAGKRFAEAVEIAQLAPSLGGPETLVTHPATMTAANLTAEERAAADIPDGLVRVSVGLEHVDDIVADFARALDTA